MAYRHSAFDHYDSILCCGSYQMKEIRRDEALRNLPKKELVEGGYYRVERVYRAAQEFGIGAPNQQSRGCVLVAPSWAAHNVLEEHGIALAESLLAADYEIIMRPHPETNKRHPDLVNEFAARFEADDRVTVERSVASDESLLRADVLITDWSGIAQEYAFGTERPVLYLDVPRKVHNDRYEELGLEPFEARIRSEVGLVFPTSEIPNIDRAIDRLIRERDQYRGRIAELREKNLFCFGSSGEVGARHILDVVGRTELSAGEAA
jgi:YidC/Oxa1 family membrane protein insertase